MRFFTSLRWIYPSVRKRERYWTASEYGAYRPRLHAGHPPKNRRSHYMYTPTIRTDRTRKAIHGLRFMGGSMAVMSIHTLRFVCFWMT